MKRRVKEHLPEIHSTKSDTKLRIDTPLGSMQRRYNSSLLEEMVRGGGRNPSHHSLLLGIARSCKADSHPLNNCLLIARFSTLVKLASVILTQRHLPLLGPHALPQPPGHGTISVSFVYVWARGWPRTPRVMSSKQAPSLRQPQRIHTRAPAPQPLVPLRPLEPCQDV